MNRNISEEDRIVIGVREWAIQETLKCLKDGVDVHNKKQPKTVMGMAEQLEKFVLRGIAD